jgi:hypothetical protein
VSSRTRSRTAAVTLRLDQPGARKDRQVRGHRVLRYLQAARDLAGRKPRRLVLYKETERFEACRLRKRSEDFDSVI